MELLIASFLAGVLTVLAPCIAPTIPILLARSGSSDKPRSAIYVIAGLSASIIIFTLLLKASTLLIGIPSDTWKILSGGIVVIFGIFSLSPGLWEAISLRSGASLAAQKNLSAASIHTGKWGDVLIGASLGPVFSACSPTYALIVAVILPTTPLLGLLYLITFVVGLGIMLFAIAIYGNKLISKLGWGMNPRSVFRRSLGAVLVIVGTMIILGIDKDILGFLVQNGWYDFQINLESYLQP